MTGPVAGPPALSSYGFLSGLVSDSPTIRQRLNTLTEQASTGKVASSYAGLGTGARISLDLNPIVAHQDTLQTGIDQATGRMQVAQTAMGQIQQIATTFYAKLDDLNGLNASEVDSVAASARDALRQVAGLLDTTDGSVYVFAGQDSGNPPVPQPDNILSSGFYSQITSAVSQLAVNGAPATIASTLATATSNATGTSPFSSFLSQPAAVLATRRSTVPVGDKRSEPVGIMASGNASIVSGGSSSTGSYMRDVMRALATIGSLNSGQLGSASQFQALISDTRTGLNGAITDMAEDVGVLGNSRDSIGRHQDRTRQHEHGSQVTSFGCRGCGYGQHAFPAHAGTDSDAGFLPAHRGSERSVAGEIPDRRLT